LFLLGAGCSALYLSGMVLNDAFDVAYDTAHRPERPIPSGKISRLAVATLGVVLLAVGVLILAPFSGGWAWGLAGLILLYDAIHKETALGLPVMAGCRAVIYPLVGVAVIFNNSRSSLTTFPALPSMLWVASGCMALWVLVLSILARSNSRYSAAVPNLLAGIPLVDLFLTGADTLFLKAGSHLNHHLFVDSLPFIGFTALALLLRRSIPPT
jgi:4-hydroxybenzoate polyprenyltransferase